MPIRLNLLAEAQAAEDQRRRDPVKRAIWLGGFLVSLMLLWSGSLQLKAMLGKGELRSVEKQMGAITNKFLEVQNNLKKVKDIKLKLERLSELSTNRFLNGNLLNALQQATAEDVQLIHLRADQNYTFTEGTKNRTNDNKIILGRPSTLTERITLTLDGNDTSAMPGDQVYKYKDTLTAHPYFQGFLDKTNQISMKNYGNVNISPENGKQFMMFTLEARYPEKTR